jgi:hypothetical protein
MPYIPELERTQYDEKLIPLIRQLQLGGAASGDINYCLTQIVWTLWDQQPGYAFGSKLRGILADVDSEFVRRKLEPYENQKLQSNGDICTLNISPRVVCTQSWNGSNHAR